MTRSTAQPGTRLALRVALGIGAADGFVALASAVVSGSSATTILLAAAWAIVWLTAALVPDRVASAVRRRPWALPVLGAVAFAPALTDGGYPGMLATQPIWLVLVAAALLPRRWVAATALAVFAAKAGVFAVTASGPPPLGTSTAREARTAVLLPLLLAPLGVAGRSVLVRLTPSPAPGPADRLAASAVTPRGVTAPAAPSPLAARPAPVPTAPPTAPVLPLTGAQREVVALLAAGLVPKQIATTRGTTLATVRTQIKHAKRRTGSRTLDELVATAAERP